MRRNQLSVVDKQAQLATITAQRRGLVEVLDLVLFEQQTDAALLVVGDLAAVRDRRAVVKAEPVGNDAQRRALLECRV